MGILPLQFAAGQNAESLGLTGEEVYDFPGLTALLDKQLRRRPHSRRRLRPARRREKDCSTQWSASTRRRRSSTTSTAASCNTSCANSPQNDRRSVAPTSRSGPRQPHLARRAEVGCRAGLQARTLCHGVPRPVLGPRITQCQPTGVGCLTQALLGWGRNSVPAPVHILIDPCSPIPNPCSLVPAPHPLPVSSQHHPPSAPLRAAQKRGSMPYASQPHHPPIRLW